MKKILFVPFLFLGFLSQAQSPQLNVKGKDSAQVKMNQLLVNVKVVGNIAYTTAEMHFTNTSARQMEAELLFPLPEGVSVSRYAIDINGKMREAVPVNKSKGKQVFEAVEHRRVDPGLLEKVDGNNFKTRIYPILPNKERIVIIGYEEELASFDKNNLAYQLVSRYPQNLEKFELNINVLGAVSTPSIIDDSNQTSVMDKPQEGNWNQSYQTSIKKVNYQPSEKFTIKIPIAQEIPSVVVQSINNQHYFYVNTFVEANKNHKKNPKSIGLIWDVSLSCKNRDLKKELNLLDTYFKELKNVEVTLCFLGYNFDVKGTFTVANGDWSLLKAQLENTKYDGGTRFSKVIFNAIKLDKQDKPNSYYRSDEFLFFTDGLSSLSDNQLPKSRSPVYTISSLPSSDYAFLNYNAMKTSASFINLNALTIDKALDKLLYQNFKFLGVKENYMITELYPMIGTPVSGSFSVSGISLKAQNEVILLFGYNEEAIIEKKIMIDSRNQVSTDVNIEKLWAQKKIANLEIQYKQNAEEIESLGKKYGIITQNTSLIVLEDINDYIQYDIVPPAELRPEFDRILKQQREQKLAQQNNNWNNVASYHNQLSSWWDKNVKYEKPKPIKIQKEKKVVSRNTRTRTAAVSSSGTANGNIRGTVSDSSDVLPGVNVTVKGTNRRTNTSFDGKYSINANIGEKLEFSFLGMKSKEVTLGNANVYNVRLEDESSQLNEIVVVAYGSAKRTSVSSASQRINATSISEESADEKDFDNDNKTITKTLQGRVQGIQISNGYLGNPIQRLEGNTPAVQVRGTASINSNLTHNDTIADANEDYGREQMQDTKVNSWSPDRIYLKVIAVAPQDKKYEVYLQLKDEHERNPNFYFDVANYFYNAGDKPKALLVLSNIADLGLENHQLYKSLTYQLRQWEAYDDALFTANQVAKWRIFEPQSHRDLGLTLEDNKQYQAGFDELVKALEVNYFGNMSGQYAGVEDIILMDINRMIFEHSNIKTDKLDKKYLNKMPVAVRIILNWNQMDTDIDLHVIEPTGEECYYGHRDTDAGARFSKDFTQGYGPEQYLLRNAVKGKFIIKTKFYGEGALTENGPTTVMVEIYTTKNGITERKLQTIQLGKIKENQNLAEITID
jgi:Vault protein inter-alpha-trypsin domain/CarboxypepD_reg-like domain